MNRQQRRKVYKLTSEEIAEIKEKSKKDAINFTVNAFETVLRKDFGFGDKRMGRVAQGLYKTLNYAEEED